MNPTEQISTILDRFHPLPSEITESWDAQRRQRAQLCILAGNLTEVRELWKAAYNEESLY